VLTFKAADLKAQIYDWLAMTVTQFGPTVSISEAVGRSARKQDLMGPFSTVLIFPAWIWKEHR
jgi:hypothetical protein